MTNNPFKKATRRKAKARVAFDGPSGSGKTFTALRLAFTLAKRVAVIDTESGSASKYAGESPDGVPFDFDVVELSEFAPARFTEMINLSAKAGYEAVVIDSLSHAWIGEGGALDLKDRQAGQAGANSFTAWAKITPMQRQMIDSMIRAPLHVIATMRSKTEYVLETNDKGRTVPRKIGLAPVQRDGMEYEFDVYGSLDHTHTLTITKSRCSLMADKVVVNPGRSFFQPLVDWLDQGDEVERSRVHEIDFKQKVKSILASKNLSESQVRDRLMQLFNKSTVDELSQQEASELFERIGQKEAGQ